MAKSANEAATEKRTITVSFSEEDLSLFESITTDAKSERRTPASYLLFWLVNNYKAE